MNGTFDILIIGAGAVGCAVARELARYQLSIAVAEKEWDVAAGTSGRNSAVVHAGFNNRPGSLMAKFCVEGNQGFEAACRELDVPYTIIDSEIHHVIFDLRKEKNPCSMCAKMRRGALHNAMLERGITKIALGHHYDDAIETFFMSLIFEGRLSCFQPVTYLDRTGITQIRPLLYCGENLIRHTAERLNFPVVFNPCPADGNTKRQEIKELVYELQGRYPGLKARAFGAMQRLPLPEWGPVEHRRRPLPEELED